MKICAIAGSLRARSFNRALLRAAQELAPDGVEIEIFEGLGDLPHYNEDLEANAPESVAALRRAIGEADAVLFATPEYNYGVPGVLKNAIDWASRPMATSVLKRKPCAMMGASGGVLGTVRGQLSLRQSLLCTDSVVVTKPEVYIGKASERFDADLRLSDEATRGFVRKLIEALVATAAAR